MTNSTYVYAYPVKVDKFTAIQLSNISSIIKTTYPISLKLQFQNNPNEYSIVNKYLNRFYPDNKSIYIEILFLPSYKFHMENLKIFIYNLKIVKIVKILVLFGMICAIILDI